MYPDFPNITQFFFYLSPTFISFRFYLEGFQIIMGSERLFFTKYLTIWVSGNHNLAILGYPYKKALKKSFRIFLALDFFWSLLIC